MLNIFHWVFAFDWLGKSNFGNFGNLLVLMGNCCSNSLVLALELVLGNIEGLVLFGVLEREAINTGFICIFTYLLNNSRLIFIFFIVGLLFYSQYFRLMAKYKSIFSSSYISELALWKANKSSCCPSLSCLYCPYSQLFLVAPLFASLCNSYLLHEAYWDDYLTLKRNLREIKGYRSSKNF